MLDIDNNLYMKDIDIYTYNTYSKTPTLTDLVKFLGKRIERHGAKYLSGEFQQGGIQNKKEPAALTGSPSATESFLSLSSFGST